jgi:hypothetical protein
MVAGHVESLLRRVVGQADEWASALPKPDESRRATPIPEDDGVPAELGGEREHGGSDLLGLRGR